jgi:hypothetical protein
MKPFLLGKKTIDSQLLRVVSGPTASASPHPAASTSHNSPQVEVVKQGDKVVRLFVTCSCGERIEVDCLYAAGN